MQEISGFFGEYRWLSNFWPASVHLRELTFSSVEAAYQAAKTRDVAIQKKFCGLSPVEAKRFGRNIPLREDWEEVKEKAMLYFLEQKFAPGSQLARKLLYTGDAVLVEENSWGDRYWGVCRGSGENRLGKLLMQVRDSLREG